MLPQSQHSDPVRTAPACEPVEDNITVGNIKPSSSILFPISTQPAVLMLFRDVPDVLPAGRRYQYRAKPDTPVPKHVIDLWRERGFDPAEKGIALVTFEQEHGASKEYTYPLYFWQPV